MKLIFTHKKRLDLDSSKTNTWINIIYTRNKAIYHYGIEVYGHYETPYYGENYSGYILIKDGKVYKYFISHSSWVI